MIYLAKCPICKKEQYGYQWTKTRSGKKWLMNSEGKWHSCEKTENEPKKQKYPNIFEKFTGIVSYFSCGKCGNVCDTDEMFNSYCELCDMYPQVLHRISDKNEKGHIYENVKPLMTTNRNEVIYGIRKNLISVDSDKIVRTGGIKEKEEKPTNWMKMKEDGSIENGYTLTKELISWFNNEGKEVINLLNEKTICVKKTKRII